MSKSKEPQPHAATAPAGTAYLCLPRPAVNTRGGVSGDFFDPAEEDEAARRIRFASGLGRQARRVGAGLITRRDI